MENNLRKLMYEQRMTMAELARQTGLSAAALYRIRDGEATPSVDNAMAIARALRVSVEEVFGGRQCEH